MVDYIFETTTTMKPYNNKKWWIDDGIVRKQYITAENIEEALARYADIVKEKTYIIISQNALKTKSPMFIDTKDGGRKQVGFVITGKTDIANEYGKYITQYVDLWVTILTTIDTDF